MLKFKLLTIIIPTYNMEKYLHRCLDSLIIDEEGMKQLEVLVINDGSKDSSSQIANEYQDIYPDTFRVIDKENGNYGSCINRGLKEATGKFVKVLDADDWFDNNNFASFLVFLRKTDSDLILSNFVRVNNEGKMISEWHLRTRKKEVNIHDINCYDYHMHSVAYKTSILKKNGYQQTEGVSYSDTEWIFYPMRNIKTISYYNKTVYNYLLGRDGQTIEETTVAQRIDQLIFISKRMINVFFSESSDISTCTYDYMKNIIIRTNNYIYQVILISCKSKYNVDKLIDYDKWLCKKYKAIYNKLEDTTFNGTSYKYISLWRKNGRKKIPDDIVKKYEGYERKCHVIFKIKRTFLQLFIPQIRNRPHKMTQRSKR